MHFKTAYLKLTAFYVLIVMMVSISFSVAIYKISSKEINRGLGRQNGILRESPSFGSINDVLEEIREQQIKESNKRLSANLVYFNWLILILATISSYFFARYTMKPIEESYESQNRFTADASHELRTPLAAMKSEIEVNLRDPAFSMQEAKELLNSNLEEIAKLEKLSSALLKLASNNSKSKASFKKISLAEAAKEASRKFSKVYTNKNIKLTNNLSEAYIMGDKDSVVELISIFLDNAYKYSSSNTEVILTVGQNKDGAFISIKDQGVGIKATDLPHIFERFYRADHSRNKERASGYGLGLSIATSLVDLHRGQIKVKSSPDKGSEFSIIFSKA